VCVLLGLVLGALAGLAGPLPVLALAVVAGATTGLLAGAVLLRLVRHAVGVHRRFTHSLLLAGLLTGGALLLARFGLAALAVVPSALALGLLLHLPGDLVTPAGVPLLYPRSVRLLPRLLAPVGEQLILMAALIAGVLLGAR
jgi:inner membrane protein